MSSWHRNNPELIGTDSDPWMRHVSYRRMLADTLRYCEECGEVHRVDPDRGCVRKHLDVIADAFAAPSERADG